MPDPITLTEEEMNAKIADAVKKAIEEKTA